MNSAVSETKAMLDELNELWTKHYEILEKVEAKYREIMKIKETLGDDLK